MIEEFDQCPDFYLELCRKNIGKDGQVMLVGLEEEFLSGSDIDASSLQDPFGKQRGIYQYSTILTRLEKLKTRLKVSQKSEPIPRQPNNEIDHLIGCVANAEHRDVSR